MKLQSRKDRGKLEFSGDTNVSLDSDHLEAVMASCSVDAPWHRLVPLREECLGRKLGYGGYWHELWADSLMDFR